MPSSIVSNLEGLSQIPCAVVTPKLVVLRLSMVSLNMIDLEASVSTKLLGAFPLIFHLIVLAFTLKFINILFISALFNRRWEKALHSEAKVWQLNFCGLELLVLSCS